MPPPVHRVESTPSTQDLLHELAASGAPAGTAVVARAQTLGRGSRGRSWESPVGGLWLSVLLRPLVEPALEVLSVRVALAVAGAIESATAARVTIGLKWPNDLMLAGRKLGGILCEARWQGGALGWVAVGVGVNVRNTIPASLADSAIALASVLDDVEPERLIEPVVTAVAAIGGRQGHLGAEEAADFAVRDWLRGRRLREPGAGTAEGVSPDGALILRRDDGSVQEVRSGSILLAHG